MSYKVSQGISIINFSDSSEDTQRLLLLSKKLNLKNMKIADLNNQYINNLLFTDKENINFYIKILFRIKKKLISRVLLINLEMYSVEFNSLVSDHFIRNILPNLYKLNIIGLVRSIISFFKIFLKFFLIRMIISKQNTVLLVPSTPRINNYTSLKMKKFLLKNFPIKSNYLKNYSYDLKEFNYKEYIYLAGNINDFSQFKKVCKFANKQNIKFLVSTNNKIPKRIISEYSKNLILTGFVPNEKIIALVKYSIACVAIYNPRIKNLKYCASSKLFEYMACNKNIIATPVIGIKHEIDYYKYDRINYTDDLDNISINNLKKNNNNKINEVFFYDSQIKDINLESYLR